MIPNVGQHVKCVMRSASLILEGSVEEWSDSQVVLKSLDDESLMIIHRPKEDIMITKIMAEKNISEEPEEEISKKETSKERLDAQPKELIKEKLAEVLEPTGDEDLDKLNIEQLRKLVNEQEKQMIVQKKKEHFGTPGAPKRSIQYSNPLGNIKSAYVPGKLPRK